MVFYALKRSTRLNIFNYHAFVKDLNITSFVEIPNNKPCACSDFHPKYIDQNHQHIFTDDTRIISNTKFKNIVSKGQKRGEPDNKSWPETKYELPLVSMNI